MSSKFRSAFVESHPSGSCKKEVVLLGSGIFSSNEGIALKQKVAAPEGTHNTLLTAVSNEGA